MQWSWPDAAMLAGPQPSLCTWTGAGRGPGFRIRASGRWLTACGPGEGNRPQGPEPRLLRRPRAARRRLRWPGASTDPGSSPRCPERAHRRLGLRGVGAAAIVLARVDGRPWGLVAPPDDLAARGCGLPGGRLLVAVRQSRHPVPGRVPRLWQEVRRGVRFSL